MREVRKNLSCKNYRDAKQRRKSENDGEQKMFALFLLPRDLSRRRDFLAQIYLVK